MTNLIAQLQSGLWTSVARSVTDLGGPTVGIVAVDVIEPEAAAIEKEFAGPGVLGTFDLSVGGKAAFWIPEEAFAVFERSAEPAEWESAFAAMATGACVGLSDPSGSQVSPGTVATTGPVSELPTGFSTEGACARLVGKATSDSGSGNIVLVLDATACKALSGEKVESNEPAKTMEGVTADLGLLFDVPLELSVEIGRVKIPVRDVVDLGPGSIVEIDKAAGEPVEVLLNGHLVAKGEVVVIDDNFGVRITEILKPSENRASEAA